MTFTRSSNNSKEHKLKVQLVIQDKIEAYLERKFRLSRSYSTRESYKVVLHRFIDFVQIHYKTDFSQFLRNVLDAKKDPIEVLDEYFSYLAGGEKPCSSVSYVMAPWAVVNRPSPIG